MTVGRRGLTLWSATHQNQREDPKIGELECGLHIFAERRAHPLLGATANYEYRVKVGITESHEKSAAPSGWMMWLVRSLKSSALQTV